MPKTKKDNIIVIGGIVSSSGSQGHCFKIRCEGSTVVSVKKMVSQYLADKGYHVFVESRYHG